MPRFSQGRTKLSTAERSRRARRSRVRGFKKWIDPFPIGFGTRPEKMVYEALSRRGIRFYYLNDISIDIPEIKLFKTYQADFILPDQKIIIEVQGARWHSMPKTIQDDAFKFALYQQKGWRPLAWWDFDIEYNVNLLFARDPVLSTFPVGRSTASGELKPKKRTLTDSSKGIRTMNKRRGQKLLYRKRAPRVK